MRWPTKVASDTLPSTKGTNSLLSFMKTTQRNRKLFFLGITWKQQGRERDSQFNMGSRSDIAPNRLLSHCSQSCLHPQMVFSGQPFSIVYFWMAFCMKKYLILIEILVVFGVSFSGTLESRRYSNCVTLTQSRSAMTYQTSLKSLTLNFA